MLNPITWYSFILGPSVAQCLRPDGLRSVRGGRDDGGGHHAAADAHRLPTDGARGGLGEGLFTFGGRNKSDFKT